MTPRMENTLRYLGAVSSPHLDAIEQDLWKDTGESADLGGIGPDASHLVDEPLDPEIAKLPHIRLAPRKDFRVYRSDAGSRVTLDTSGVMRLCDAGGNIINGIGGKGAGAGARPHDVHHLIWNAIRSEAKRRGIEVEVVLAEKTAERPGEALTVWKATSEEEESGKSRDAGSSGDPAAGTGASHPTAEAEPALPAPSTLPRSYHQGGGVSYPRQTVIRNALATAILQNEIRSMGPDSTIPVGVDSHASLLLDDRAGSRSEALGKQIREDLERAGRVDNSTEDWMIGWDDTAEILSASSDPQWDHVAAAARQAFMSERDARFKDVTGLHSPTAIELTDKLAIRLDLMRRTRATKHRSHQDLAFYLAMVSLMISRAEFRTNPKAQAALKKEFLGLSMKCWDERKRRPRAEVIAEARSEGRIIQFASIHGSTVEKAIELLEEDPRRKFKGRAVLLGSRIWNQDYEQACFADLGNAPTLLEGGRSADAYGCLPGHAIEQADAIQAFIQAPMTGTTKY